MKATITCVIAMAASTAFAGTITTYSDRTTFNGAVGSPLTIEDFGPTFAFPISTGVLNSQTDLVTVDGGPILPGDIEAGVTYSTAIGTGNFFNIDFGAQYEGGFLDGIANGPLYIDFTEVDPMTSRSVSAFGFDMGSIGGSTSVQLTISFEDDDNQIIDLDYNTGATEFFGFVSSASDITSVSMLRDGTTFSFDMDNFTFNTVPSPSALSLVGMCGLIATRRRR